MPRANRYILPRQIYHITHRCHDRAFLLRFTRDRSAYRELMGLRQRYRIIDLPVLIEKTGAENLAELRARYLAVLDDYMREGRFNRDPE